MSVSQRLASSQGRKDEALNRILAQELVEAGDSESIKELIQNLYGKDKALQGDSIKTLYEIGYLRPELISDNVLYFLKLLSSRNNRLIWGAMMALSTIADIEAARIYENVHVIYRALKNGSVITVDSGVKVLAKVAAQKREYSLSIFPALIEHLRTCRIKEIPQHSESILVAVNASNKEEFISVLKEKEKFLSTSQLSRVKKLYKKLSE